MFKVFIGLLWDKVDGYLPYEAAKKTLFEMLERFPLMLVYEWLPTKKVTTTLLRKYDCIWLGSDP